MVVLLSFVNQSYVEKKKHTHTYTTQREEQKKKEREENEYYLVSGCVLHRREHTHT